MISENRRNLSASCAASCANQIFRKVVLRRTARKPPGLSTSNLKGSALNGSAIAGAMLAAEYVINAFPLVEGQGLRPSLGVDTCIVKTPCRGFAADPRDPAQGSTQLLAPELKHRLDEPEEGVHVGHIDRRLLAHVQQHQCR